MILINNEYIRGGEIYIRKKKEKKKKGVMCFLGCVICDVKRDLFMCEFPGYFCNYSEYLWACRTFRSWSIILVTCYVYFLKKNKTERLFYKTFLYVAF